MHQVSKRRILPLLISAAFAVTARPMARYGLALEIDKDAHAKLPDAQKSLYVEKDGKFRLDVDDLPDTSGLKSALEKERENVANAKKELRTLAEKYKNIDPDKYKEMMDAIEDGDQQALLKAGKIDELFNKKTEKLRKALEGERDAALEDAKKERAKREKYQQRVLEGHLVKAAAKAGVHEHAYEDAMIRGRTVFTLDDDGNAVQLGSDGKPVAGKDGKTPFGPDEWMEGMKSTAKHWFPAGSSGGGAGGGDKGAGGAKTMTRKQFDQIADPAEKSKAAREFKIVDEA